MKTSTAERLYIFLGRHTPELIALLASSIVLVIGIYLAWAGNPVSLNRAGTLITIIGVLLAASRFHEWLADKAYDVFVTNPEQISQRVLTIAERQRGAPLCDEERESVLRDVAAELSNKEEVRQEFVNLIQPDKKRLKAWELYLVIGGELFSGFGDYIIATLKA